MTIGMVSNDSRVLPRIPRYSDSEKDGTMLYCLLPFTFYVVCVTKYYCVEKRDQQICAVV